MFRRILFFSIVLILMAFRVYADTFYLNDGRIVEGKIVDKNNYSTKVEVNGQVEVFYSGQITRIVKDEDMGKNVEIDYSGFENISKQKAELIVELLKANGLTATLQKSIEDAVKSAPADRREEFKTLFDFNELVKILIPIFDLYYNEAELKELIQIYEKPVRQKEIANTPAIIKEALETMVKHIYDKSQGKLIPSP